MCMAQAGLKLEPGQFFGTRFQIVSLLGRGAMGVVYRALDHEAQREVALKILSSSENPAVVSRFVREGELTAALSHPGIVTVHSGGAVGAYPYLAYELVADAQTLADLLPRLDHMGRAALLLRVAEAVGYAHDQGIFHRDLKPENVLVTPEGAPRVADFGLASGRDLDRLTQSGAMIGTPSYMSPEQISGQRELIGAPSDVWSLGVILYEALTGELPFAGDSILSLAATVMRDDPQPPRALDSSIPEALEAVCLAAIRREPDQRYPNATAFAEDLSAALRGERPSAGSSSTFQRAIGTPGSRKRRALTLAAAVAPALLALAGGLWFALRRSDPPPAAPSATPAASPTRDPAQRARAAKRSLGEAKAQRSPILQLLALEDWLQTYPESDLRGQALELVRLQAERQAIRTLTQDRVEALEFTSDTTLLAVGQGQLRAWDLSRPGDAPVWTTAFEDMAFYGAAYVDEERFLISLQGGIHVVGRDEARLVDKTLRGQWVSLAFEPARRGLATGRISGKLTYGRLSAEARYLERRVLSSDFDYYRSLALSRGGRYLAAGAGHVKRGCGVCLWDLDRNTPAPLRVVPIAFEVEGIHFTPDGQELILLDDSGGLRLLALATGEIRSLSSQILQDEVALASRVAHLGLIRGLLFLDGDRLLTCSGGSERIGSKVNSLGLWDLSRGQELDRLVPQPVRYRCLALSPGGSRLAIGREGKVEIRSGWVLPGDALSKTIPR